MSKANTILAATVAAMLVGTMLAMPNSASATQSEWDFDLYDYSNSPGGVHHTQIEHNNNLLINDISIVQTDVYYTDGFHAIDAMDAVYMQSPVEDHTTAGKSSYYADYYIGDGVACSPTDWKNTGCYKYRAIYDFWDPVGTASAKFKPVLQVYGPGYQPCGATWDTCVSNNIHGYGFYLPNWRADITTPGTGGEVFREKNAGTCSGWTTFDTETTQGFNNCTGQVYRFQDAVTGYTSSFGIDPVTTDSLEIIVLKMPTDGFNFERYPPGTTYDGTEDINDADDVMWYSAGKIGNSGQCIPGFPCKIESTWIPNGDW